MIKLVKPFSRALSRSHHYRTIMAVQVEEAAEVGLPLTASENRCVRGVVFDMDGTLIKQVMDFNRVRRNLGISPTDDILAHIESLKTEEERKAAFAVVEAEEQLGLDNMEFRLGCQQVLSDVRNAGLKVGLLTRNCQRGVDALFGKLREGATGGGASGEIFSEILTREFHPPKPSAEPLLHICRRWSLSPSEVAIVGDGGDDMRCGENAGSLKVLINTKTNKESAYRTLANIIIDELPELMPALKPYLPRKQA